MRHAFVGDLQEGKRENGAVLFENGDGNLELAGTEYE